MAFVIDSEKCVGCGACALFCLFRSVKASDENASKYYIREHHCMECGQCIDVCPNSAISAPENFRILNFNIGWEMPFFEGQVGVRVSDISLVAETK